MEIIDLIPQVNCRVLMETTELTKTKVFTTLRLTLALTLSLTLNHLANKPQQRTKYRFLQLTVERMHEEPVEINL